MNSTGCTTLQVEHPEGPQSDQAQFRVLEGHRIPRAPLQVRENFHVDEVHLRPETGWSTPTAG